MLAEHSSTSRPEAGLRPARKAVNGVLNEILKWIKGQIGRTGITTGEDLEKILKPVFGKKYIGIYMWNRPQDLPVLREGEVAVLNKDTHWTAIYRKDGKLKEIDSYNRDLLGAKYKDDKVPSYFKQPIDTADCGQRTLAKLIYVFQAGLS